MNWAFVDRNDTEFISECTAYFRSRAVLMGAEEVHGALAEKLLNTSNELYKKTEIDSSHQVEFSDEDETIFKVNISFHVLRISAWENPMKPDIDDGDPSPVLLIFYMLWRTYEYSVRWNFQLNQTSSS